MDFDGFHKQQRGSRKGHSLNNRCTSEISHKTQNIGVCILRKKKQTIATMFLNLSMVHSSTVINGVGHT